VISTVDLENKLLIVKNAEGILYDFLLNHSTVIELGEAKCQPEDLASAKGKDAEVTFRMMKTGNVTVKIVIP
jgi:hypothetical protein